jgi:hypothetical protein
MTKSMTLERFGALRRRAVWMPFGGPQVAAYLADGQVDVIGYGGAGGGGKTDLALGLAMHRHRRTIFYRRTFPQLEGAEDRAREIFWRIGKYTAQKRQWTIRTTHSVTGRRLPKRISRTIRFRAMQYLADREKVRGNPADLMVFDEAQNFLRDQVLFATAWNRTSNSGQHCTVLLTFNPPATPEGLWLLDFFAPWVKRDHPKPARPGEVRWFVTTPDGIDEEVAGPEPIPVEGRAPLVPRSRTFFPARVGDNPVYRDSGYLATLDALPEPLRSQMRDGDMEAGLRDDAWQVIPTIWIRAAMKRGRETPWPTDEKGTLLPISSVGADVAAGGDDRTVFARAVGDWVAPLLVYTGKETPDGNAAAGLLLAALGDSRVSPNIDSIGIGQGLVAALKGLNIRFQGVNAGAPSYARARGSGLPFVNLRAELLWNLRELLDPENPDGRQICLPDDPELFQELATQRWSLTISGIQIEPKEDIQKRLSPTRSPDKADALALAFYKAPVAGYGPALTRR